VTAPISVRCMYACPGRYVYGTSTCRYHHSWWSRGAPGASQPGAWYCIYCRTPKGRLYTSDTRCRYMASILHLPNVWRLRVPESGCPSRPLGMRFPSWAGLSRCRPAGSLAEASACLEISYDPAIHCGEEGHLYIVTQPGGLSATE